MPTAIIVQFDVPGLHHWPGGHPNWLRTPHRHLFHVRIELQVFDADRELEIQTVRDEILSDIAHQFLSTPAQHTLHLDFGTRSCEMLAEEIARLVLLRYDQSDASHSPSFTRRIRVEVLEDNELGGVFWT